MVKEMKFICPKCVDPVCELLDAIEKQTRKEVIEEIKRYFKLTEDIDTYVCGCGCGETFEWTHGMAQRIRIDLLKGTDEKRKQFIETLKEAKKQPGGIGWKEK